jgi:hypothetical protein
MGVDPQNPDQLAPPPQDDALRGLYRDDSFSLSAIPRCPRRASFAIPLAKAGTTFKKLAPSGKSLA